jgi:hypothetical protein
MSVKLQNHLYLPSMALCYRVHMIETNNNMAIAESRKIKSIQASLEFTRLSYCLCCQLECAHIHNIYTLYSLWMYHLLSWVILFNSATNTLSRKAFMKSPSPQMTKRSSYISTQMQICTHSMYCHSSNTKRCILYCAYKWRAISFLTTNVQMEIH